MFNYGIYKKQLRLHKEIQNQKKEYLIDQEKRREAKLKLSLNYKKRVENFVINMLENPIVTNEYKGPKALAIRDEHPQRFLGDAQIYVKGFKHEKDRIEEAIEKNKDLDFLPNQVVAQHQFRMRDISKEIQPDMRFKDKTSLERIEQFLKDHTQTQVENMDFNRNKKAFKFDTLSESMSVWEYVILLNYQKIKQIAKNLLPSLHQKTHFQATQTLFNKLPLTLCENSKSLPKLKNANNNESDDDYELKSILTAQKRGKKKHGKNKNENQKDQKNGNEMANSLDDIQSLKEGQQKDKGKQKGDQLETFNPVETSKQVLNSCNILRKKNPKVKLIHRGDGHLISTLDRSISEMYMDIYNIDLTTEGGKIFNSLKSKSVQK